MLRTLIFSCLLVIASQVLALHLRVHGNVTDLLDRSPLAGVEVRVYKDGVKQHVLRTGANGAYEVVLDNDAHYVIRFMQAGRVPKCFAVSTHGGAWADDKRVMDLEVEMTLFRPVEGVDLSWFDLPMGMARFQPMTGHISWNADYERRIRGEAERLMAQVKQRHQDQGTHAQVVQVR